MAFPKENRLKREKDFRELFQRGKTVRGDFLFVRYLRHALGFRVGISVPSTTAKKAVHRNRIRRAVSEALRKERKQFTSGDIVVVVTKVAPLPELTRDLLRVLAKINSDYHG